jgi:hypothetical protein
MSPYVKDKEISFGLMADARWLIYMNGDRINYHINVGFEVFTAVVTASTYRNGLYRLRPQIHIIYI